MFLDFYTSFFYLSASFFCYLLLFFMCASFFFAGCVFFILPLCVMTQVLLLPVNKSESVEGHNNHYFFSLGPDLGG